MCFITFIFYVTEECKYAQTCSIWRILNGLEKVCCNIEKKAAVAASWSMSIRRMFTKKKDCLFLWRIKKWQIDQQQRRRLPPGKKFECQNYSKKIKPLNKHLMRKTSTPKFYIKSIVTHNKSTDKSQKLISISSPCARLKQSLS